MGTVFTILRHKRVLLGVALLLLLLIAQCSANQKSDDSACAPGGTVSASGLAYPVEASTPISSGYGDRDGGFHHGVDFALPIGSPVYALADGTVTAAQDTGVDGFGGWVVISHVITGKAMSTVYGHMDPGGVHVIVGQQVSAGDVIASSGNSGQSSGPHLHFELHDGDRLAGGPSVDPTDILQKIKDGQGDTDTGEDTHSDVVDRNATLIISAGLTDDVPDEVIVRTLATALVEDELRNRASEAVPESKTYPNDGVAAGDHLSVGVLQQQVGMGYGSVEELMKPEHQARNFFARIMDSNWESKSFTESVADIQKPRSDLRGKYGDREAEARALFARLAGRAATGGCSPTSPGTTPDGTGSGAEIVAAARTKIGAPYVWGGGDINGATGGGFDCSGLTLYAVYTATGQTLPHYTGDSSTPGQLHQGQAVTDLSQAAPGDLVFFGTGGDATHVGIYSGTIDGVAMMIHAPQQGQDVLESAVSDGGNLIGIRRITATTTEQAALAAAAPTAGGQK